MIIDGSQIPSGPADIGFVINASNSILRGLAIGGFNVGVSVPNPTDAGDLIQGNFIGQYVVYPVDPMSGAPLPAPDTVSLAGIGNTQQGVFLGSTNTTVGGTDPQDNDVIAGNGAARGAAPSLARRVTRCWGTRSGWLGLDRRLLLPGRQRRGRGVDRVFGHRRQSGEHRLFIEQHHRRRRRRGRQRHLVQRRQWRSHRGRRCATRNLVEANYIAVSRPAWRIRLFGSGNPGNEADGVWLDDAPDNQVGGLASSDGNVISSNQGDGVDVTGNDAVGTTVLNNVIGLTARLGTTVSGQRSRPGWRTPRRAR